MSLSFVLVMGTSCTTTRFVVVVVVLSKTAAAVGVVVSSLSRFPRRFRFAVGLDSDCAVEEEAVVVVVVIIGVSIVVARCNRA